MSLRNDALMALIRNRLVSDFRVASQAIDVRCFEDCVSLVGVVDTAEQKRLAVELISGLVGVGYVKDELKLADCTVDNAAAV